MNAFVAVGVASHRAFAGQPAKQLCGDPLFITGTLPDVAQTAGN